MKLLYKDKARVAALDVEAPEVEEPVDVSTDIRLLAARWAATTSISAAISALT